MSRRDTVLTGMRSRGRLIPAIGIALLALVAGFGIWNLVRPDDLEVTAVFPRAVGLYPNDQVRVLGVPVGTITAVDGSPSGVRVTMTVRPGVKVPADASAVLVAPSLVSGRYVQLTPAWTKGPQLQAGATIPKSRTQVPVEWDELKSSLNTLGTDLGPAEPGSGQLGPLGKALEVSAKNLQGNGEPMRQTLDDLSRAVTTLSDNRGDIFATVRNLAAFTGTLARSDTEMRSFAVEMAQLSDDLNSNRQGVAQALKRLQVVLPEVGTYVQDNRPLLRQNLSELNKLTTLLGSHQKDIADTMQLAPTSVSNVYNIYDPVQMASVGSLALPYGAGTLNALGIKTVPDVLCQAFKTVKAPANTCTSFAGLLSPFSPQGTVSTRTPRAGDTAGLVAPFTDGSGR